MFRWFLYAPVCALAFAACSSSTPRLHQPNRIDAFCGDRVAIPTAIESVVSSTGEASSSDAVPSYAKVRQILKGSGGIIAHWNDQPLYQPSLAKLVGSAGDYVTLGDVAIANGAANKDSRPVFLTVRSPQGAKTYALRAYDIQDVCNEGTKSP